MHRPLVLRPSAAGLPTDSVTSFIADKQSSVRVEGERKKEEKGEKKENMSRVFGKKTEKKQQVH